MRVTTRLDRLESTTNELMSLINRLCSSVIIIEKRMDELEQHQEIVNIDLRAIYSIIDTMSERINNQQMMIENLQKMIDIVKGIAENKRDSIIRKVSDEEMTGLLDSIGRKADKIVMDALSESEECSKNTSVKE